MITLHLLVEKQQKIKKCDKKISIATGIVSVLFLLSIYITAHVSAAVYALISLALVFMSLLIFSWINANRLDNNTELIAKNIERILYSTVNDFIKCIDVEITFKDNNKTNDDYLCFLAETYGSNVTFNDLAVLAAVLDPVVEDINKILHQSVVIYYRIDNDY